MSVRITRLNDVPASYQAIMRLQDAIFNQRKADLIPDTILMLQHSPVYTIGKRGNPSHFRTSIKDILATGSDVVPVPRGGETTYHGPGQLVVYPIVNLRALQFGARRYVESLEDIMIDTAKQYGIVAKGRLPHKTGVWVNNHKLGAVGVAISSGITRHGLALNVTTRLSDFHHIIACGDDESLPTSIKNELERGNRKKNTIQIDAIDSGMKYTDDNNHDDDDVDIQDVAKIMIKVIQSTFGYTSIERLSDVNDLSKDLLPSL